MYCCQDSLILYVLPGFGKLQLFRRETEWDTMDDIREAKPLTIKRRGDIGRAALKPPGFFCALRSVLADEDEPAVQQQARLIVASVGGAGGQRQDGAGCIRRVERLPVGL